MMKKESFILVHAGEAPAPEIIQLEPEHLLDGMYQAIHRLATVWYGDVMVGNVLLASEGYRNGEPDLVGLNDFQLKYLRDAFGI